MRVFCRDVRITWVAHALPLYVARFGLSPAEGMELYASMELHQLIDAIPGSNSARGISAAAAARAPNVSGLRPLTRGVHPHFLRDPLLMGCMYVNPLVEVPDMRCIQSLYLSTYGIDLPTEYHAYMSGSGSTGASGEYADMDFAAFMHQFIALLHVASCSIQMLVCVHGRKVSKVVPR